MKSALVTLFYLVCGLASATTLNDIRQANCSNPNGDYFRLDRDAGTMAALFRSLNGTELLNRQFNDPNGVPFHILIGEDIIFPTQTRDTASTVISSNVDFEVAGIKGTLGLAVERAADLDHNPKVLMYYSPYNSGSRRSEELTCKFSP